MFHRLRRARERRRLETIVPNPRGKSPLRRVRRGGAGVMLAALAAAGLAGMLWAFAGPDPAATPAAGFHDCGNGRLVRDAERCGS